MSEENTVTILDLLNLSLGTPEIGAVNFNLLHRFLLELVKHLSIARKQIDITDDISIQSALEETRMLSGAKSQTHFFAYSSLSEQGDSKRLNELRAQDSPTTFSSGKLASETRSRDSVGALEKPDTATSRVQGSDNINGLVRSGESSEGGSRTRQDTKQVMEEGKEELQTKCGTGERGDRTSAGSKENLQMKRGSVESGKAGGIEEAQGNKENVQVKGAIAPGESHKGQVIETRESKESMQTKRSTGEMDGSTSFPSGQIKTADGKDTKDDPKQRSPDERVQFKAESSLSQNSLVVKSLSPQSALHSLAGRSSVAKESKRTSPASSKTDIRKRSFIDMVPGLYQLERKISILEAKFESLSAGPTNLELVQQARDLQSRDSSTTAAGDMWQAMNLVRRIEVAEGGIDGITAMLDDICKQLKRMKEAWPDDLSNKLSNTMTKSGELQSKLVDIDGKLKNVVIKTDLKPFITVKKMNEMMDYKLQNYRQLSPTVPKSPKKTISSKLAQTDVIEVSSQPAQTSPTLTGSGRARTATSQKSIEDRGESDTANSPAQIEAITTSDEQAPSKSETPSSEQAAPGTTATTPFSEKAESEQADYDGRAYSEIESVDETTLRDEERVDGNERRGSVTTEAFEELYTTMQDWGDFREVASQKIHDLEERLLNTVDKDSMINLKQELNNLAGIQSTLKESQQLVKDELKKLAEFQNRPVLQPIASQHDLSQLETSVEGRMEVLNKNIQEMKQNFFQLYEMKESVGGLKESEELIKSDVESIRRELLKIMKELEDEQEARKVFESSVGRRHSHGAIDSEEIHNIRSSLLEMRNEIEKQSTSMSQVIDDQNKKQLHLEALYGHVDQLENIKADRQQINLEIEVKADRKELETKVSQDKFQNSLSSLDQSVQDLLEKLVGHEATLKQAINHITSDVNTKLDKMDMDTVKNYFEGKLKDLNSKVQRKPNEDKSQAAASRCMLLQPANCISCDRPVHLYREGAKLPSLPLNKPLPCSKSNRPYISCDLNDVRQKMYDLQKQRKVDQTESLGQAKVQNELLKLGAIKDGDDFQEIANRPCGGNHTLTCPEKRTTIRVNKAYREDLHFIAQLSQKDLSIVDILGYDGHVYKGHVNQLPSIPEIPKNTMIRRPTTGSGRPRTSSPI